MKTMKCDISYCHRVATQRVRTQYVDGDTRDEYYCVDHGQVVYDRMIRAPDTDSGSMTPMAREVS